MLCLRWALLKSRDRQIDARAEAIREMLGLKEAAIQIKFTCGEAPSIALSKDEEALCNALHPPATARGPAWP
jgi:hypothetical protein